MRKRKREGRRSSRKEWEKKARQTEGTAEVKGVGGKQQELSLYIVLRK